MKRMRYVEVKKPVMRTRNLVDSLPVYKYLFSPFPLPACRPGFLLAQKPVKLARL